MSTENLSSLITKYVYLAKDIFERKYEKRKILWIIDKKRKLILNDMLNFCL